MLLPNHWRLSLHQGGISRWVFGYLNICSYKDQTQHCTYFVNGETTLNNPMTSKSLPYRLILVRAFTQRGIASVKPGSKISVNRRLKEVRRNFVTRIKVRVTIHLTCLTPYTMRPPPQYTGYRWSRPLRTGRDVKGRDLLVRRKTKTNPVALALSHFIPRCRLLSFSWARLP